MPTLAELGRRPPGLAAEDDFGPWLAGVAGHLLNGVDLVANGAAYRFVELEAYYHGPGHPDPFAHRDPVQLEDGRWYFHRTRGEYRGGSFKGLDLALGDGSAYFGVLVRGVVGPDGVLVDGPSLTVDHLLARCGAGSVAALDAAILKRKAWDATSPVYVRDRAEPRDATVYATSRVGLSLKKAKGVPAAPRNVGKPYRYVTEPRRVTKGKPHLVLALHRRGESVEAIRELTGCPRKTVERYVADFAAGKKVTGFDGYVGKELSTGDLCRLLGTWAATHGSG
ncbi:MAG: hypothetical protein C0501_26030 [Isosphaera sp.]|nr:hypothetical protein [Isosphaera sp.]